MLIKNNLRSLKKVNVGVCGIKGQTFRDGKKSHNLTVYDANPDEVWKIILKALSQASGNRIEVD